MQRGHIPALDGLRGLAILLVSLYRFTTQSPGSTGEDAIFGFDIGQRGVDLFFVLSGFLITGILFDTKGDERFFRNFYMRRTLRIFPLYYAALLLVLWMAPAWGFRGQAVSDPLEHQSWLWFYGANIFVGWHGEWGLGCLNHFWSLCVEEHFYLVWPLVIFSTSRKSALWICGALILCTPLARAAWLVAGGNGIAAEVFTPFRLDALAVGAWLSLMVRSPGGEAKVSRWAGPVAIATGLALLPTIFPERRLLCLPDTIFAIFFGAMLILAVKTRSANAYVSMVWNKFCNLRVLRFFGKFSYGMYVFQNLLIPVCALWFTAASLTALTGSAAIGHGLYVVLMFAATVLVSLFSWHFFEKHFLSLKKYFEHPTEPQAAPVENLAGRTLA